MQADGDSDDGAAPLTPTVSREPRYEGEDTSPTAPRELKGWYCYGIAAEVFAVCGPGSFLPVTMEQLARENGVLYSDRTTPCIQPKRAAEGARLLARAAARETDQCIINLFGSEITTAAFAMYTFSVAVFVQAIALVSFSSVADHGDNRKRLLVFFAVTGSIAAMCFLLITPSIYPLGSLLSIVAIASLGCSFVMLNSFLPLLASNHPAVRSQEKVLDEPPPSFQSAASPAAAPTASTITPALRMSNRISSRGVGLGYAAAVLVQIISICTLLVLSKITTSTSLPLRVVLFLTGAWWFTFTLPTSLWLRTRPGPPLPSHLTTSLSRNPSRLRTAYLYVTYAWTSLFSTLRLALSLSQPRLFLFAWFLLSDAIATVGSTAIMFARTELRLSPNGIALLSITATCSGIAGSLLWPVLSRRYGWPTNKTIVYCLCLMEILPLYGLLGYLPPVQQLGWLGLQQAWEIFPLAVIHGVAMGGLSSYCRSFFGQLIPKGHEVAFYALFAITDKGSSAIGPAVVGRVVDATGSIRPAFWFLTVLVAVPAVVMRWVDEERGRREAAGVASKGINGADERSIELPESPSVARQGEESEALMGGDRE